MSKTVAWTLLILFVCGIIYLFGIGFFTDNSHPNLCECSICLGKVPKPPMTHTFYLCGDKGGLPMFFAFCWFCTTMVFIWSLWHYFWGNIFLKRIVSTTFVIGFILLFACSITKGMGNGHYNCDREGCLIVLEAKRNQIKSFVVCPLCGETNLVTEDWWN